MSDKLIRRRSRIDAERLKELERKAFFAAQPKGSDNPIRISEIPCTRFEG